MASSESEGETSFEVDQILAQRKRGRAVEYLVRWKGFGDAEDSWEPARNLAKSRDVIKRFEAQAQTPSSLKQQKTTSSTRKGTSKSASSTVTKTTTVTKVETSKSGTLSASSSPDSSPVLTRRTTTRTQTTSQTSSTGTAAAQPIKTPKTDKDSAARKSFFSCSWCEANCDLPTIILLACLLFLAASFVMYPPN